MRKKEIPGFENYIIYEDGRILSKYNNKFLSVHKAKQTGYKQVNLYSNGKRKTMSLHRLLALTFIPNINNLPLVDHIDRNRLNNDLSNLRWYGYSDNVKNHDKKTLKEKYLNKYGTEHSSQNEDVKQKFKQTNLEKYGDINPGKFHGDLYKKAMIEKYGVDNPGKLGKNKKPIIAIKGSFIKEYSSITECANDLGFHSSGISNFMGGRKAHVKGYTFKYKDEG